MIIDILAYRDWAIYLAGGIPDSHLHSNIHECCEQADLTFLIGWSDIVPEWFYDGRHVLVLHPSPLPRYRGGSPIQHQILNGEVESAVTLFLLHKEHPGVDSGPIYRQAQFSLEGNLSDIFSRIISQGEVLIRAAISEYIATGRLGFMEQDEQAAITFKRRKPEESEITLEDIKASTALQLYNKVRALQDPYPNAFIRAGDGSILYLTQAHL